MTTYQDAIAVIVIGIRTDGIVEGGGEIIITYQEITKSNNACIFVKDRWAGRLVGLYFSILKSWVWMSPAGTL